MSRSYVAAASLITLRPALYSAISASASVEKGFERSAVRRGGVNNGTPAIRVLMRTTARYPSGPAKEAAWPNLQTGSGSTSISYWPPNSLSHAAKTPRTTGDS
jgi:hypothetical protein